MKTRILVVDDEPDLQLLIEQKFRRNIRDGRYEFTFAANGREALELLTSAGDIDVVLSDINMPEMDGLALLGELRTAHPLLKTVMVSAYGDMANIRAAMNRGAFDFVCKPVDFLDLEQTIEKTSEQVRQLRQSVRALRENNRLRMYVDAGALDLLDRAGADDELLQSEVVEATVAFYDICGFTSLSEKLSAATIVGVLNAYFDEIVRGITAQGGTIDKFIGDAVMAVFRGPDHLTRAVQAAVQIRNQLAIHPPAIPAELQTGQPAVACGINTGEMVSGNIGSASLQRLDFTVIGDAVNLAQRLQSAAGPGQILVAEATWNQLAGAFRGELLGERVLKNKAEPVRTYLITAE
jgi:adenylate cyclase